MKLGKFDLSIAWDGFFKLDGGAMFGVVPKPLWSKSDPSDERNRILLGLNPLVIRWDSEIFIVDTGMGDKWDEKTTQIYGLDRSENLIKSLNDMGISKTDVTGVIQTHLHFDHSGGSTEEVDGEVRPTFPNATYYINRGEWDFGMNANERTRASYLKENFVPLRENKQVEFVSDGDSIVRGIDVRVTGGHTPNHQAVMIESEGKKACYTGDLIPTASHIKLPYIMGYDTHPMDTLKSKKEILKQALEENWLMVFPHSPRMRAGYLQETERGVVLSPVDMNKS